MRNQGISCIISLLTLALFACQGFFGDNALGILERFTLLDIVCPKHLNSATYLLCAEHFIDSSQ